MDYLKKIIVISLACIMLFSLNLYTVNAADTPSSWAESEIDFARSHNILISDADREFQSKISRELFCRLIVNMVEETKGSPVTITIANPFNDTNNSDIIKAYQLGIVKGVSATEFSPSAKITREEVAVMMMRAARKLDNFMGKTNTQGINISGILFADQTEISSWALQDVKKANVLNIMNGVGGKRINPKGNTTVEQSILLIVRLYNEFTPVNATTNTVPTARDNPVELNVNEQTSSIHTANVFAEDSDGDTLSIVEIDGVGSTKVTANGRIILMADGRISYVSNDITADIVENFNLTITDGTDEVAVNVVMNVTAEVSGNTAPTAKGEPIELNVNEQTSSIHTANVFAEDSDGDTLSIIEIDGVGSTKVTANGRIILMADGRISYVSNDITADVVENFNLTITDGTDEVAVNVIMNVTAEVSGNTAPTARDNPVELNVNEQTSSIHTANVFAEDSDGDTLSIVEIDGVGSTKVTANGRIILMADGRISYVSNDITADIVENFNLTITDGTDEVAVNVIMNVTAEVSGNTAPTAKGEPITIPDIGEMMSYTYKAEHFAEDINGDHLSIVSVNGGIGTFSSDYGTITTNSNGTFTYQSKNIDSIVTETFLVKITDGNGEFVDVNVIVNILPRSSSVPVAKGNPIEFTVAENNNLYINASDIATDNDGDELKVTSISLVPVSVGRFNITPFGRLDFEPNDISKNNSILLAVTVTDGANSIAVNVKINVIEVGNTPPQQKGTEDITYIINEQINFYLNGSDIATDSDGEPLEILSVARTGRSYGAATIDSSRSLKRLHFISKDVTSDKTASYRVTVSDGTDTTDIDIKIKINKVNQAPTPKDGDVPVTIMKPGEKEHILYLVADDIAEDADGDTLVIEGIYRLNHSNTSYDIPGERLDLSPHYGYVYFLPETNQIRFQGTKDLVGYVEEFYARVSDGEDTTDIKIFIKMITR